MRLLYADADGNYYDHPALRAAGRTGDRYCELAGEDLIEMPSGASLVLIPGGHPVGVAAGRFTMAERGYGGDGPAFAVGALLPQGYTRTLLPAFRRKGGPPLPLLGYAAVAWRRGKVYVAAVKTDSPDRWDPRHYNTPDLPFLVKKIRKEMPGNRIVRQLSECALEYSCFTAQNIFYGRWEGGIPVSRSCNAGCLGCISLQPAQCCPSPQSRITFTPSVDEVAGLGLRHFEAGGDIISFGQGCEGEPSLEAGLIRDALILVRRKTPRGTINMNTNAGNTTAIEELCGSGLDSIRVSLISARREIYDSYYRPRGYGLINVQESLKKACRMGVYTSLNLLVYPGLTDREEEAEALAGFISETGVKLVQLRNLNIDPDYLFENIPRAEGEIIGIPGLLERLRNLPGLEVGSFSRAIR